MKKFFKDFKEFATKGNVIDMAVGVVIGGAFGKIVTSLVGDIITPLIGMITGGTSLTDKKIVLHTAVLASDGTVLKPENALTYGAFLQNILDFLIIAFSIFLVIRIIGSLKRKAEEAKDLLLRKQPEEPITEEAPAATELSSTDLLLVEIRDLLKEKNSAQPEPETAEDPVK